MLQFLHNEQDGNTRVFSSAVLARGPLIRCAFLLRQVGSELFFAGSCMAQRSSLSGRSPFCQLVEVKKGSSAMMISTSSAFKQQKPEETRDKPRERKKTASQRVSEATA